MAWEQLQDVIALYGRTLPANAIDAEQYVAGKIADAKQEVSQVLPQDAPSLARARQQFAERLRFSLLATLPATEDLLSETAATLPEGEQLVLGRAGKADRIPALWIVPAKRNPQANATLLVHPKGIAYTLASLNDKSGLVRGILDGGGAVLAIDAFQTGSAQARATPRSRASLFSTEPTMRTACRIYSRPSPISGSFRRGTQ